MCRMTPWIGLLLVSLAGCSAYDPEPREFRVRQHSAEDVFAEIVRFAASRGFGADPGEADETKRLFVSAWRGGGLPIRSRSGGFRVRLRAEVVPVLDGQGWRILYYFERQRIGAIGRGIDPKDDDWVSAGQDVQREREFEYVMNYTFHGEGIGTGVEKRSGNDR